MPEFTNSAGRLIFSSCGPKPASVTILSRAVGVIRYDLGGCGPIRSDLRRGVAERRLTRMLRECNLLFDGAVVLLSVPGWPASPSCTDHAATIIIPRPITDRAAGCSGPGLDDRAIGLVVHGVFYPYLTERMHAMVIP